MNFKSCQTESSYPGLDVNIENYPHNVAKSRKPPWYQCYNNTHSVIFLAGIYSTEIRINVIVGFFCVVQLPNNKNQKSTINLCSHLCSSQPIPLSIYSRVFLLNTFRAVVVRNHSGEYVIIFLKVNKFLCIPELFFKF